MIQDARPLFNLPANITYLNCAYMSPLLKVVEEAGIEGIRIKRDPSVLRPDDFFQPLDEIRMLFTDLLNLDDFQRVAVAPSVSYGMANVANNIHLGRGENAVIVQDQFPSNYYIWADLCERSEAELRIVDRPRHMHSALSCWDEDILAAIDDKTRVVSLPHVHWADGFIFDLVSIRDKSRRAGAYLVIDGTQSFGALPFDQETVKADALICSAYKWLLGPYGIALCYYGEAFDNGRPIEYSWMNRLNSDNFANLVDYQRSFRPGAKRYEVGESSNFIHIPMVAAALRQVLTWSPESIQQHCQEIAKEPFKILAEAGFEIDPHGRCASHLFGIEMAKNADLGLLKTNLQDAGIFISVRGRSVRISPHCYNSTDDLMHMTEVFCKKVLR